MRTRLLAAVAVLAAALIVPSAAFAAPTLLSPGPAPVVTNQPIDITWDDLASEVSFQIVSGDPDIGGNCPATPDNRQLVSALLPVSPMEYSFTPGSDATTCYYVEANDGVVAATESDGVRVTYDHTPPTGSLTAPANLALVQGAVNTLSANVSDALAGVSTVRFERSPDGSAWTTIATSADAGPTYTANWNTGVLTGTFFVRAFAIDAAGNTLGTPTPGVTVTVDNSDPTGSLTAPAASALLQGSTNLLSATASDTGSGVSSVRFERSPDNSSWTTIATSVDSGPTYTANWDTATLAGTFFVRAFITDGAGHTFPTPSVSVTVDNSSPTGAVTAPSPSALLIGSTNALSATASDTGTGVSSVRFERSPDGSAWSTIATSASSGSPYTANWDTGVLTGTFQVRAFITDGAGHTFPTAAVSVTVDNSTPTASLDTPGASALLHGTTNALSATASDTGSGVSTVVFQRSPNGTAWTTIATSASSSSPYTANWNTTSLDGAWNVRVVVTDGAGHTLQGPPVAVSIDNTAPTLPGIPTGASPVSALPTFSFTPSTDIGGSGINRYDVYRTGTVPPIGTATPAGGGLFAFSDSGAVAGTNTYSVVAVDNAGNSSAHSADVTIFLDPNGQSAPTGLTPLATPTNQRPQFSWVAPASFAVAHYRVTRVGGPTTDNIPNTTTTFTDGSGGDSTYTYQVVAVDSNGVAGTTSAPVTIVFDTTAPAAPPGVSASAALDGSVTINWSASSDAGAGVARYVVRRSLSSTPPASVADGDATCQVTSTSCTDATTLNGKLYTYSVFAIDRAGNTSLAGASSAVTARDQLGPVQPSGLAATPGDASIALRWTAAGADDDVAGYVLVAKPGSQAPTSDTDGTRVCAAIVATSTACTATGLTNGATYTFGLFALDEALNRSQPATVSAAPNGKVSDTKAPAAITKLKAKVSGHKVTLTWANPGDKDFDHVEITAGARKPAALKASKRVYSGKGTKTGITLAPGQSRWFVVVAYDAVGNASPPASVHVSIAPASLFGPAPRAKVHGKVRLSWPVAKGARYYNVQLYAGKKRIFVSWPNGRGLQVPRAKLKRGTKYTWYVWPGLGAKAKARYGKLIGKSTFTFAG
jgi:fibronectin type 3 domain-containing protein